MLNFLNWKMNFKMVFKNTKKYEYFEKNKYLA